MKKATNIKRSRLLMTFYIITLLSFVLLVAVFKAMPTVSTAAIGGILTRGGAYIAGDSFRPSGHYGGGQIEGNG